MKLSTAFFCFYWPMALGLEIWKPLPEIPAGHRAEYYLLHKDGGYKHGWDTGTGIFAKAKASPDNEVQGHFGYPIGGNLVDIKYTAGVQGYVPEGDSIPRGPSVSSESNGSSDSGDSSNSSAPPSNPSSAPDVQEWNDSGSGSDDGADKSYSFSYSTADSSRSESSDASGNVQGQYAYTNDAGNHDLSYKAGADTGFIATGGSLSVPNGLGGGGAEPPAPAPSSDNQPSSISSNLNPDGSYSFSYSAPDSSRSESGDANGNVEGQYAYRNDAGNHDLSYTAGAETGFVVTGGSLGTPNGLGRALNGLGGAEGASSAPDSTSTSDGGSGSGSASGGSSDYSSILNEDGSYSFSYTAPDSSRSESGDASGNVQGQYAYQNNAGNHDLSYKAGAETGFVVTGGSLGTPNGLGGAESGSSASDSTSTSNGGSDSGSAKSGSSDSSSSDSSSSVLNDDGSYSFSYAAPDSSRSESGDASGNVQGKYAYQNNAGNHDLSYSAGADTGFVVLGGSLAIPNGLPDVQLVSNPAPPFIYRTIGYNILQNHGSDSSPSSATSSESADSNSTDGDQNGEGEGVDSGSGGSGSDPADAENDGNSVINSDGSYSFSYNNPESSRRESGDANGNVEGYYAYVNQAGRHDLFYESGAETGFVAFGGSLSAPNGLRDTSEADTDSNQAGGNTEMEGSGSDSGSSTARKVHLNFGDLSAIKLLPVSENAKVGYILE